MSNDGNDQSKQAFLEQFRQSFADESREHLDSMENFLVASSDASKDDLDAVFRAVHSFKGNCGVFGFNDLMHLLHAAEDLMDLIRQSRLDLTEDIVDELLATVDLAREILDRNLAGETDFSAAVELPIKNLRGLASGIKPVSAAQKAQAKVESDDDFGFFSDEEVVVREKKYGLFDPKAEAELKNVPEEEFGFFDPPTPEEEGVEVKKYEPLVEPDFGFFNKDGTPINDQADQSASGTATGVDKVKANAADAAKTAKKTEDSSLRVSTQKIDTLVDLVGELVITQSMILQNVESSVLAEDQRLQANLRVLERHTRMMQEAVLSIRMLPIGTLFSRFPRLVKDLSKKLGKKIDFITQGESTEVDKSVIESLADPLIHLIRNSIDHGIESEETRISTGKSPHGTIRLGASHSGGKVVLTVRDDGAGLNRKRIVEKALEKGIIDSGDIPDSQVWPLIFAAGFSTAETITDVSGRGVGMDVVRRNIQELGGDIELDSVTGKGTTITVRLPMTLSIIDGMSVRVGDEIFVLPLASVIESIPLKASEHYRVMGKDVMCVREEMITVIDMANSVCTQCESKPEGVMDRVAVIVEADGLKSALLVDELLGQAQYVVKSLESNFRRIVGISGATILGDGAVALIIDLGSLLKTTSTASATDMPQLNSEKMA